jgi:cysteine protease ATG4
MILAQTLIYHFLGREYVPTAQDMRQPSLYKQILRLFTDSPNITSPFSVHNIVARNKALMRHNNPNYTDDYVTSNPFKAEPWFAPSSVCRVLKHLVHAHGPSLAMYVPNDPVVYINKILQMCTQPPRRPSPPHPSSSSSSSSDSHDIPDRDDPGHIEPEKPPDNTAADGNGAKGNFWRSVFILIPMRLGIEKINPTYFPTILACLRMSQTVGIIGGKPKQAYWFVGFQDDFLIYLDPHVVQESVQPESLNSDESFHCSVPQKIHIDEVDPSLAIGFYCHTREDFDNLCNAMLELEKTSSPLFTIEQEEPVYD